MQHRTACQQVYQHETRNGPPLSRCFGNVRLIRAHPLHCSGHGHGDIFGFSLEIIELGGEPQREIPSTAGVYGFFAYSSQADICDLKGSEKGLEVASGGVSLAHVHAREEFAGLPEESVWRRSLSTAS